MRVALLTTSFPRWTGDSRGPFILETARALRDQGIQVRLITLHSPGAKPYERLEGIDVYRVRYAWPERWQVLADIGGGLPIAWRLGWRYRVLFVPMMLALIGAAFWHGRRVDLIHAHWTLAGIAAWLTAPLTGRPFVLTVHGSDVFTAGRLPVVSALTRAMLGRCQRVIAVSRALRERVITLGAPPERIDVVPNGIDRTLFKPAAGPRSRLLVFVGSLIRRKAVDVLLAAAAGLERTWPDLQIALIGEGPERAALEAQAEQLGLHAHVRFVGPQTQAEVAGWMRQAYLFVLPSREEGMGVVLLEALASGTPCIASRTGGIVDILHPQTGILCTPGDVAEFRDALRQLLTDEVRWEAMSRAARAYIETQSLTWADVARHLARVYQH